jgi:adenine-specific DNA-methyltransferase
LLKDEMAKKPTKPEIKKTVETLTHEEASRKNIPTAEFQSVMHKEQQSPVRVAYERRNRDLDPQLVWRGKDEQDWSDLVTHAPPIYIQEKVHPKVLIDDLLRRSAAGQKSADDQFDLFADFNGVPEGNAKTEFYQHDANWTNRMILGDSLQVMASLAEREGLQGQVQCIYIDPPYGIKFNSNFQWSTTSRDVKDGNVDHITREPEQVKAFRDTWREGVHSYLTYLRDRLTVARDLLTESGSVFVQIGDENVYRVRALVDEVFGDRNFVSLIHYRALTPLGSRGLSNVYDYVIWYAKAKERMKYRNVQMERPMEEEPEFTFFDDGSGHYVKLEDPPTDPKGIFKRSDLKSSGYTPTCIYDFDFHGYPVKSKGRKSWRTNQDGMQRLIKANRLFNLGDSTYFRQYFSDSPMRQMENTWTDTAAGFSDTKVYVVQTHDKIVTRCMLMTSDPGDLVLDPTCGSGTTAYVAEHWARRWITIDTSRVALALARVRAMGARYPYYLLADSHDGKLKEAEVTKTPPSDVATNGNIRQGFVLQRVPRVTLGAIANNTEIDVIWDTYQEILQPLRKLLNDALERKWGEWEIPREADDKWPQPVKKMHADWWQQRIARQKEIDASIAAKADFEYLYDKPYDDKRKVRVAGPFTVESLSPHRVLGVDENDELIDGTSKSKNGDEQGFVQMILENLKTAGVQQAHKEDKIAFSSITPWPGYWVCAEGRYTEGTAVAGTEKRAAIFIGPEFGTVSRPDLVEAAREAGDAGFDVLIACAFNYDARSTEFDKLGRIPVLKARMNADLHMADDLKNTGKGNLFVIFGEPDIDILEAANGQIQVKVKGVDVFHPNTGEVRSDGVDGIACWFIDTDYNQESFFVRHAYFLGANDPYKSLKTTLKAEVNEEAWATLNSDTSRPFDKPKSERIAVKVINHLGDEVMKVFRVDDPRK